MRLVIAEKPSVAKAIAPVVGAKGRKDGYFEGNGYIVSWCYGHLVGLYLPNEYSDDWSYKTVTFEMIPMLPDTSDRTLRRGLHAGTAAGEYRL